MNERLFNPPSPEELRQELGLEEDYFQELLAYLVNEQQLVKVNQEVYFSMMAIEEGKRRLEEYFAREKS